MSMRSIVKDSVDQSVVIRIIDSTTGLPETAVEHNTAGIDLWYRREGALQTSITEAALAALDSAHTDGGIEHMGHGYYRLDLPDAAVATGVNGVMVGGTVTGMIVIGCYVPLIDALLTAAGIVNEWETQSQADPTGFHVNTMEILSQAVTLSSSNKLDVNAEEISDDGPAAVNLESQFDGTGYVHDTAPATQSQLAGIANVGAAVNTPADSYTLTTGTQSSGTVASTQALDGTNHEHTDDAGAMDLYYEFIVGSGIPTSVIVTGYLNGNNDDLEIYGYDWVATAWVRIGTLAGKNASTNEVQSYDMFINMVGSGANQGIVRVRFTDGAFTLSTATLAIDQIFVSFSRGAEGYDNGAIWIDTGASNTNTVVGVDGTATNPVSTMAAANTLAASTNLNTFQIAAGSTITLAASQDNQMFHGMNWTLLLGGQSISGTHIDSAMVSGICTGASRPMFTNCHFGATTLPPAHLTGCGFENTITAGSAGDFSIDRCHAMVGGGSPIFDFGGGLNASNVNFSGYAGAIEIQNMGAGSGTYTMALDGNGELTLNANCSATSNLSVEGNFRVTDNASGAVTVTTDDDTTGIVSVESKIDALENLSQAESQAAATAALNAYDPPTRAEATTDKDAIITEVDANETKIDALENLSQAESQAAATAALNAYDPPTRAEATTDKDAIITEVDANETKIDALENLSQAESQAAATAALNAYDPPTRAEATTDKDDIITEVDANETKIDAVKTDTAAILIDTNELQGDWTNGGRLDLLIDAIKAVTDALPDAGALNDLATILADTNELQGDWANGGRLDSLLDQVITDIAALENVSAAQVNAEVLDVLNVDTFGEPAQGAPPETTTIQYKLSLLYKMLTNQSVTDVNGIDVYNRAETIVDHQAAHTDAAGIYTRRTMVSG